LAVGEEVIELAQVLEVVLEEQPAPMVQQQRQHQQRKRRGKVLVEELV
jgi:hypothetical protein